MKKELYLNDFLRFISETNNLIRINKERLCQLDSQVGDGDHGTTIARGFYQVMESLKEEEPKSISNLLLRVGDTLTDSMGGASGPIFGSLFKGMGVGAKNKETIKLPDLFIMYDLGASRIKKIGKVQEGEKTMLDSLMPAINVLEKALENDSDMIDVHRDMALSAIEGAEATKSLVATKGRARYAGQRGIGHQDAGATSVSLIMQAAYNAIR